MFVLFAPLVLFAFVPSAGMVAWGALFAHAAATSVETASLPVEPSDRARVLAQGISILMNSAAFGLVVGIGAASIALVARLVRRPRKLA